MKRFFVYQLVDPRDVNVVRYIGVSCNPVERKAAHIKLSNKKQSKKDCWIYSILAEGVKPEMVIINEFDNSDDAYDFEQKSIDSLLMVPDNRLTNARGGGKSNFKPTEETRLKMREAYYRKKALGQKYICHNKPHTEETKRLIAMINKGKSPPNKGKPMSIEQNLLLRAAFKGRKAWNKGKAHSDEHRLNLCKAWALRKDKSPITEETRRLLSEKATAQWARKREQKL